MPLKLLVTLHGEELAVELPDSAFVLPAGIMSFEAWIKQVGRSRTTGFEWRRAGMIETHDICGRPYVTQDAVVKFLERTRAGEFAATK